MALQNQLILITEFHSRLTLNTNMLTTAMYNLKAMDTLDIE